MKNVLKPLKKLYDCSTDNISLHLKNIYNDLELDKGSTTVDFSIVQHEIACDKALTEFEKYRVKQDKLYKSDFDLLMEESEDYNN